MIHRAITLTALVIITLTASAPWATSQSDSEVPAYNAFAPPPNQKLPAILTADQLWDQNAAHPYQTRAYQLAAKIPEVLHQQPCYCYCDRMGHNSLHSCFEGTHAAQCPICLKELYYSYSMHKKGRTAAQIRQGIIAGEWKEVNLASAAMMN